MLALFESAATRYNMLNAIGSSPESNPSLRICNLRAIPQVHVADNIAWSKRFEKIAYQQITYS